MGRGDVRSGVLLETGLQDRAQEKHYEDGAGNDQPHPGGSLPFIDKNAHQAQEQSRHCA
jgi:hypothetical protein